MSEVYINFVGRHAGASCGDVEELSETGGLMGWLPRSLGDRSQSSDSSLHLFANP